MNQPDRAQSPSLAVEAKPRAGALGGGRIAFFGGSFDPPHAGHLAIARAARSALRLDRILFAPVGAQPLKPAGASASFEDRLEMTRLAIAGEHGFALSLADRPRATAGDEQAPNYTIDTLARLRAELAAGSELFCLMGADAFFGLRLWHRAAALPFVAQLIVAARPGQPLDDLRAALPNELTFVEAPPAANNAPLRTFVLTNPAGEQTRMYVLPDLEIPVSATDIREQLSAAPNALAALAAPLPESVAEYIRAHGLYR